ncbi:hypothetical protein RRG08_039896 [Elysia crispata]|uniref:Uncharacterized protein n=1 Tax=Elysia crispata TaxID=231223 RepID=A0AAE1DNF9_9GAST|nr:hypothetical protein RRG08_039896 [Elysia crispata]
MMAGTGSGRLWANLVSVIPRPGPGWRAVLYRRHTAGAAAGPRLASLAGYPPRSALMPDSELPLSAHGWAAWDSR